MRTYPAIFLSTLLLATIVSSVAQREIRSPSSQSLEARTTHRVSAQAEQKDDISPHRGSGRRE